MTTLTDVINLLTNIRDYGNTTTHTLHDDETNYDTSLYCEINYDDLLEVIDTLIEHRDKYNKLVDPLHAYRSDNDYWVTAKILNNGSDRRE